jgi:hypothetical protein
MKQTLFVVFDTETSCQAFPVYDMAWRIVDRQGREYNRGSYFMPDVIERITPIFRKHEEYPEYVAKGHVEQRFYQDVKDIFNRQVKTLREKGHRILLVAYNADFDRKALKRTAELMGGSRRSRFFRFEPEWVDLWQYWAESAPLHYTSERLTENGNWKSSLEEVFRFENHNPEGYAEKHTAWSDTDDAISVLEKVIRRKKRLPVYKGDAWMSGGWRALQKRCPGPGKTLALSKG